jgi:L-aspartate oxidase
MREDDRLRSDFVVVGAGVAGLRSAIELARRGQVLMLAKGEPVIEAGAPAGDREANDQDEFGVHERDTLLTGEGLCNPAAVKAVAEEGPRLIREAISRGAKHHRAGTRHHTTGPSSRHRPDDARAQGESIAREVKRALYAKVRSLDAITLRHQSFVTELVPAASDGGRVGGLRFLDEASGRMVTVECRAVLLATGGLGQAFRVTTNSPAATGDGMAIGFRAGAALADMEFVEFHPLALEVKGAQPFPLPEALAAEGAVLRNALLERFMPRYHEAAELAPSVTLCRAIVTEMKHTRTDFVYLDCTGLDEEFIAKRFAGVHAACMKHGLDITADLAPVAPAAHYAIGGLKTDLFGRTTLPGLYAAGEAASAGVHGANRVPGNCLLEELVFGARAGAAMGEEAPAKLAGWESAAIRQAKPESRSGTSGSARGTSAGHANDRAAPADDEARERIRAILWRQAGILRHGRELRQALGQLGSMEVPRPAKPWRCAWEVYNLWTLAQVIARCALAREESRGTHYRADFPYPDDDRFARHSVVSCEGGVRFE